MSRAKIAVFHGPNLNLLGIREPDVYGEKTLEDINQELKLQAEKSAIDIVCRQSNSESQLIEWIHQSKDAGFIIINPGAFTHTSIAIRDALAGVDVPFVEIHLSNTHAREPFRKQSYFSDIAVGTVCGFGFRGYLYALSFAIDQIKLLD